MITETAEAAPDFEARGMSTARVAPDCGPRSQILPAPECLY